MDIEGQVRVEARPDVVWHSLCDPRVLERCIPGCEAMTRLDDDRYECRILARYGPVRATFLTILTLSDIVEPVSYTLTGRSHGGIAGFGEGSADVRLEPAAEGTVLRYSARITAHGRVARAGSRLLSATTHRLADRFFSAFAARVAADAG